MTTHEIAGYLLTPATASLRTVTFEDGPDTHVTPEEQMKALIGCERPAMLRLENITDDVDLIVYHDPEAALHPTDAIVRMANARTSIAGVALILQCDGLPPDHPDATTFGITPSLPITDLRPLITIFKPLVVPLVRPGSIKVSGFNVKVVKCIPSIVS